jgi:hypothetical protein
MEMLTVTALFGGVLLSTNLLLIAMATKQTVAQRIVIEERAARRAINQIQTALDRSLTTIIQTDADTPGSTTEGNYLKVVDANAVTWEFAYDTATRQLTLTRSDVANPYLYRMQCVPTNGTNLFTYDTATSLIDTSFTLYFEDWILNKSRYHEVIKMSALGRPIR